ncbi:MAG: hypothetical protein NC343_06865 [Muribaculum sp.]|nr:hypothetical protein [Muribaculaceae bacterium]MCM1081457.1 hypothetical protein [Muribaculum sp.]
MNSFIYHFFAKNTTLENVLIFTDLLSTIAMAYSNMPEDIILIICGILLFGTMIMSLKANNWAIMSMFEHDSFYYQTLSFYGLIAFFMVTSGEPLLRRLAGDISLVILILVIIGYVIYNNYKFYKERENTEVLAKELNEMLTKKTNRTKK